MQHNSGNGKWLIRKHKRAWDVWRPDGAWSGTCETHAEAIDWATNWIGRLEYWLEHQARTRIK